MYHAIISSVVLRKRSSWQPSLVSFGNWPSYQVSTLCIRSLPPGRCWWYYSKYHRWWVICSVGSWFGYCRHETKLTTFFPSRNESIWFSDGSCLLDRLCNAILALRGNRAFRDDSYVAILAVYFGLIPLWLAKPWEWLYWNSVAFWQAKMASHHLAGNPGRVISIWFLKGCSIWFRSWIAIWRTILS